MTYRTLSEPKKAEMAPERARFLAARRLALNLIAKYPTTAEELVRDIVRTEELLNVVALIASRENLSPQELVEIGKCHE